MFAVTPVGTSDYPTMRKFRLFDLMLLSGITRVILTIVKTAVSIPDPIFEAAERTSKRLGISRSRFYALAIEQLIERQQGRGIQELLDEVYATENSHLDETLAAMQSASIRGNRKSW